ncbi:MAG TPA: iron-sulfur cluster repair di-iron protein, partial [Vicinamibacterales bacterium]|nr:iron-sulfur cluster repair di-iron protein [Vicinamibacterales bacterium]
MIEPRENTPIGEIVATDFRAAEVFEGFGIDFCCGGRRSLLDACQRVSADLATVIEALEALPPADQAADDVSRWPLDRLIDYIVQTHHAYIRAAAPVIAQHLAKMREAHGERHPELARVANVFDEIAIELSSHLRKEEQILFSYIQELCAHDQQKPCGRLMSPFGTVENPIRMMEREHREAADGLRIIRELTQDYAQPADGCSTYAVTLGELSHFERDLHRHVHL